MWISMVLLCVYEYSLFSGGTFVTIHGSNFDSVAAPRITLTVIVTSFNTTSSSNSYRQVNYYRRLMNINKLDWWWCLRLWAIRHTGTESHDDGRPAAKPVKPLNDCKIITDRKLKFYTQIDRIASSFFRDMTGHKFTLGVTAPLKRPLAQNLHTRNEYVTLSTCV